MNTIRNLQPLGLNLVWPDFSTMGCLEGEMGYDPVIRAHLEFGCLHVGQPATGKVLP
jgi:hypothetical protein